MSKKYWTYSLALWLHVGSAHETGSQAVCFGWLVEGSDEEYMERPRPGVHLPLLNDLVSS
jgi:hypothetical protein